LFVQEDRAIATTTTRKRAAAATGSKPKAASKAKTAAAKTPAAASKTKTAKTTSATKKTAPARKTGMTKVTEAAAKAASKLPATKPKTAKNTTAPKAAAKPAPKKSSIPAAVLKLHQAILTSLDDDKAENIVSIDLTGKSSIADFLVVASGRSSRQVAAIARHRRTSGRAGLQGDRPQGARRGQGGGRLGADRYRRHRRPYLPPGGAQLLQSGKDVGRCHHPGTGRGLTPKG
jgi:hypothetical protein